MISRERDPLDCCSAELDDESELDRIHENRPGLPTLPYRLGHHGDFFLRMLDRIPNQRTEAGSEPPLSKLTYRGKDDPTVALVDACASLLEVLTFYQERIVNEAFIRTSIERRSVLELARSIGYEMRPGVAASTLLTFTVDDSPGSPEQVVVPKGTQILSIPKKDELPQTFETIEDVETRVEWNAIEVQAPSTTLRQTIYSDSTELFLTRKGPRLRRGDVVLLIGVAKESVGTVAAGDDVRYLRRVHEVTDFPSHGYRRVELQSDVSETVEFEKSPQLFAFGLRTRFFGHNAPDADSRMIEIRRMFGSWIQTPVTCVALSPVDRLAATGFTALPPLPTDSEEDPLGEPRRTLRIWNVDERNEVHSLLIAATITAVAFSADGKYLAATTHDNGAIEIWIWAVDSGASVVSKTTAVGTVQDAPVRSIIFQEPSSATAPYRITTLNENSQAVTWEFTAGVSPTLQQQDTLNLAPLGIEVGDPRHVEVEDEYGRRSLTGDDDGITTFIEHTESFSVPDEVTLEGGQIDVDGVYTKVIPESWVLLEDPEHYAAYQINAVTSVRRSEYGITKRITRLGVASEATAFSLRETAIYAESDELTLAEISVALPEPIEGTTLSLVEPVEFPPGHTVIIEGRPAIKPDSWQTLETPSLTAVLANGEMLSLTVDTSSDPWRVADGNGFSSELTAISDMVLWDDEEDLVYEAVKVANVTIDGAQVLLTLADELTNVYDWRTVRIRGNVAQATHGETVTEVLGSGDGLLRNQRFKLKKPPLTFIAGATGQETTLEVRINNVLWSENDSLLQMTPVDEGYIVRIEDDGATRVTFGDGEHGARLPSGAENVVATYRSGLGPEGEVEAGQLALLKTKPLGIRDVVNPLPATGAAPPEHEDETRDNAPRTVLVLGRVVSIQDYEDFAKSFPGVGKAQAVPMWDGYSKFVHLSVGTQGGDPLIHGSPLYESLRSALDRVRDTHQSMVINGFQNKYFGIEAKVLIDKRYLFDPVVASIHKRLTMAFSYDAREFGQNVTASEVIATIHEVDGVVAVDLNGLYSIDKGNSDNASEAPTQHLEAKAAYRDEQNEYPAELLLIEPTKIDLGVLS